MRVTPMKILVVDDCRDTARMMRVLLKRGGHEVGLAFDGPGALEAARSLPPDVVLLDVSLPGMSGPEVAEALRGAEGLERTAIVAISGYGADALPAVFDGHFTKPVDHDALAAFLATLADCCRVG
jgi:CheY-like chemotaxis protein